VLSLFTLLVSCRNPAASLAVIDPVFAYLSPDSVKAYSAAVQKLAILPDSGASAALYASIDAQAPRTVFLSPLLATEIGSILSRNDQIRVVYLGTVQPELHPRLHAAFFSSIDAASRGGTLAAEVNARLMADLPAGSEPPGVAGIFAGTADAERCSDAFAEAYREAGGPGEPLIEISATGFAQAAAERLKTLDIRVGYIAADPRDAERWARQAFDQNAYLVMEYSLPAPRTTSLADAFVVWDMDATLSVLVQKLESADTGMEKGLWKTVPNDQTEGNRR